MRTLRLYQIDSNLHTTAAYLWDLVKKQNNLTQYCFIKSPNYIGL